MTSLGVKHKCSAQAGESSEGLSHFAGEDRATLSLSGTTVTLPPGAGNTATLEAGNSPKADGRQCCPKSIICWYCTKFADVMWEGIVADVIWLGRGQATDGIDSGWKAFWTMLVCFLWVASLSRRSLARRFWNQIFTCERRYQSSVLYNIYLWLDWNVHGKELSTL